MSPFRYRDDDSSSGIILGAVVGALAGFAAGMFLAQSAGKRARAEIDGGGDRADEERHERLRGATAEMELDEDYEDAAEFEDSSTYADDYEGDEDYDITLEERVLEAFRNDPVLSTRAVDIGSLRTGVIELAGVVDTSQEAQHAVTIARGVPGVTTVVNRIVTGIHEPRYHEAQGRHRQASAHDVERTVSEPPIRADRTDNPSTPPNVVRADEPPRASDA
jgi:osmotically-inducible protein OsmY